MKNATIARLLRSGLFSVLLVPLVSMSLAAQVPFITQLVVVDAETDTDLAIMTDGMVIPLDELAGGINIRAEADSNGAVIARVRFSLDDNYNQRTESAPPYALAGDTDGDYFSWLPDPGDHLVTATPFYVPEGGEDEVRGDSLSINFTVTGEVVAPEVDSTLVVTQMVLVDATTDLDILTLEEGMNLYLDELPTDSLNVRAEGSEGVASMTFGIEGTDFARTESGQPWAMWGDSGGDYSAWVPGAGVFGLQVTPWSSGGGAGDMGVMSQMNIAIPGLVLIDADTDKPLMPIMDGDTLNLNEIAAMKAAAANLNIQAAFIGVGSVVFSLDGEAIKTETAPPYALAGDSGGDYNAWEVYEPGQYTLMATPYSQGGGGGDAGKAVSATFVIEGTLVANENGGEVPSRFAIESLYPNPFNPTSTLRANLDMAGDYEMRVYSVLGQELETRSLVGQTAGRMSVQFNLDNRASGIYFVSLEQKATGQVVTAKAILMK